jgi:hypothetical protein
MRKVNLFFIVFCGILLLGAGACSSDDGDGPVNPGPDPIGGDPETVSKYIITATPLATEGVADYLLTADDLGSGSITTEGNGIEQDGTYRYYVTHNNKFFSLLYGQGNPGAVTTYQLDSGGALKKLSDFQAESMHVFGPAGDDILMIDVSRSADDPISHWYRLDTNTLQIVAEGEINGKELANKENGEIAHFSWMTAVGDKIFLPYFTMKACCDAGWETDYPDEANIAVYSYPGMEYIETISDDRTSFIGRYFSNGLTVDEQGDAYAFSAACPVNANWEIIPTLPSAITRIPDGSNAFDDYYFNIEEASGGYVVNDHVYAGNGKFVGLMQNKSERIDPWGGGTQLAVIDVYNKTFEWISGTPEPGTILFISLSNIEGFTSEDGKTVSIGITTETASHVYNIDVASATATKGLEVVGGQITAINRLEGTE